MSKDFNFVKKVAKDVDEKGGKVYFVGGYVRDKILNNPSNDIDVEVYGLTMSELKDLLSSYGEVEEIGASFGILMVKGFDIDFALPRTEVKTGDNHTDFEVVVNSELSLLEATKRRDFTMNAILQDVLTCKYIDLYGGIKDIENKVIRFVDEKTYADDELRALRACQFASRLNFTIDEKVIEVSKGFNFYLSKERIYEEVLKALMKSDKPSVAFNYMFDMEIVEKIFPELYALKGCEQNEHHPEGDVWNHTMMVIDESKKLITQSKSPKSLMFAALCHDMGKPESQEISSENKITFYNHEVLGLSHAESFLKRLTNENNLKKEVLALTRYHMHGHKISEVKESTLRKLIINVDIEELMLLAEADAKGRGGLSDDFDYTKTINENIESVSNVSNGSFGKIEPFFRGSDLLDMGSKQGSTVGILLKEAYEKQLDGQSKEHIESFLVNKINPKPKENSLEDIIDLNVSNLIKYDKATLEHVSKRLKWFKALENEHKVKYKRTKKHIPYMIQISIDKKYKYVLTPVMVFKFSLDNKNCQVVLDIKKHNIEERKFWFKTVMADTLKSKTNKPNLFESVLFRLNSKKV